MLTQLIRRTLNRPWLLVAPIGAAVVAIGVVIAALLFWSALQVDHATAEREQQILSQAIARSVLRIGKDQEASTVWDDAVSHVRSPDAEWFDANLGIWMHAYYGHDETFVLDGQNEPIYAMIGGARAALEEYRSARPAIPPLVRELRRELARGAQPEGNDQQTVGIRDVAVIGDHPAIVSVKPIVSDTGEIEQAPGTEGIHVSVRYLDASFTSRLATNYHLKDARFSWQDDAGSHEAAVPYTSRDGSVVGYLIWSPYLPGSDVRRAVEPALAAAMVGIALIIGVLVFALRRGAAALKASEALARHLAEHDALTDLPNRMLFDRRLRALLSQARSDGAKVALLALDLDQFKQVNDSFGHPVGDELLRQVAKRLRFAVRGSDTVARVGGDEFSIVLPNSDDELVHTVCSRLLAAVQEPFDVSGHSVSIGLSIGVAVAPLDAVDEEQLIRRSDLALYSAKRQGKGRFVRYSRKLESLLTPGVGTAVLPMRAVSAGA